MPKKDQVRPVISSPVGPIKSSRGPDLVRSDNFRLVDGIKDCQGPSASEAASDASMAAKNTRSVSASFQSQERPAANPTVARSSVNATTPALPPSAPSSRFLRRPSFPSFGRTKTAKSLLPTSSTASMLPTRARQVENVMPTSFRDPVDAPQPPQPASKLPKSRTMNVLQDLKNSISRQNLSARFNSQTPRPPSTPAPSQTPRPPALPHTQPPPWTPAPSQRPQAFRVPAPSQMPVPSRVSTIPGPPHPSAQSVRPGQQHAIRRKPVPSRPPVTSQDPGPGRMPQAPSQTPPVQAPQADRLTAAPKPQSAFSVDSSRSATPEPDQSQIVTAQPMEYWTGRFSRLNDIYLADDRAPETLLALRSGLLSQHRQHIDLHSIDEDDARHLHIFAHLEFMCATEDARQSLRDFQRIFARRFGRPLLLPEGSEARGGGAGRPPSSQTRARSPYGTG